MMTTSFRRKWNRPIRLTQCCTQFKSPGVKILCVLYLHHNVACSRLRDSGGKSFSNKKCEKRAGAGESRALLNFAFNTSPLRILSESLAQANYNVAFTFK